MTCSTGSIHKDRALHSKCLAPDLPPPPSPPPPHPPTPPPPHTHTRACCPIACKYIILFKNMLQNASRALNYILAFLIHGCYLLLLF